MSTDLRDVVRERGLLPEDRIDEATSREGVDLFVVSCPKDVTMYEDAIRATGNSNRLLLQELTEMIAEAHARAAHPAVLA